MASTFNAATSVSIQRVLALIGKMIGNDINLSRSASFRAVLESSEGTRLGLKVTPLDMIGNGLNTLVKPKDPGVLVVPAKATGTLVAGELATIALPNASGDLLAVAQVTAGGSAADHFSAVRVSDTLVKAQAHDAAGALVAGNTSVVAVYNLRTLLDWL